MISDGLRAYRAVVHGRVQGVGFRYSAMGTARSLGLCGWVRNLFDGSVETHFEGSDTACRTYLSFLKRGPGMSRVERVDVRPTAPDGTTGFRIK